MTELVLFPQFNDAEGNPADDATAPLEAGQVLMYGLKTKTSTGTTQVLAGESLIINSTPTRTV